MRLDFRYVNIRFDFRRVDSSTTLDEASQTGYIGHDWSFFKYFTTKHLHNFFVLVFNIQSLTIQVHEVKKAKHSDFFLSAVNLHTVSAISNLYWSNISFHADKVTSTKRRY